MLQSTIRILAAVALAVGLATTAAAADWGNLKGQFIYDGKAPKRRASTHWPWPGRSAWR